MTETDTDIEVLSLEDTSKSYTLVNSPQRQASAIVHPGGEWVAYISRESGQYEIYIRHISGTGGITQVTIDGGSLPIWSHDGKNLYYLKNDKVMAVPVQIKPQLQVGKPKELFEIPNMISFSVASDGRFIIAQSDPSNQPQLVVVTNWFEELKRLTENSK